MTLDQSSTIEIVQDDQKNVCRPWTVVVVSHNHPEELADLLMDIEREADSGVKINVRVYDNASDTDLSVPHQILQSRGWQFYQAELHHGKRNIWRWLDGLYGSLKNTPQINMIAFLPQNVRLCKKFFRRAQHEWESIDDPRKIALTILVDVQRENTPCWTDALPQRRGEVFRTQWVDNAFVAEVEYLKALNFRVPAVPTSRWNRNPDLSSGVGRMISVKLHRAGYSMYRLKNSLVKHTGFTTPNYLKAVRFVDRMETVSNEGAVAVQREDVTTSLTTSRLMPPLKKKFGKCPVVASMATIPGREATLARTVASILPQVDQLNVYLNGIETVPDCLKLPRITVARSLEYGDIGDAGKFWWSNCDDVYMLTCDDDIIYPPDYVARMLYAIEHYQRAAVVGVHGVLLHRNIRSYYRDRSVVHSARELTQDQAVHMVGTGCAGWHSSTLNITRATFKHPNMADVWFGIACQQQHVPTICIARPSGWLKIQEVTNTIFDRHRFRDRIQTQAVMSVSPWKLFSPPCNLSQYPVYLKNLFRGSPSKIRVSVIVPVGSNRGYLGAALESAAGQDYPKENYEVIVVNDGCAEVTEAYVRGWWKCRAKLRYAEIPKSGLSAAVNRGLEMAVGEYITILPDDDIIYPGKLSVLCGALDREKEISVVYSLPQHMDEHGNKMSTPESISNYLNAYALLTWQNIKSGKGFLIHGTSTVYRTAALLSVGGFDENLDTAEEFEFHLRLLKYGFHFLGMSVVTTAYRIHSGNKSKRYRTNRRKQMEYIRKKLDLQGINLKFHNNQ